MYTRKQQMQEAEERVFFHSLYENKIMNNVGAVDFLLTVTAKHGCLQYEVGAKNIKHDKWFIRVWSISYLVTKRPECISRDVVYKAK